MVGLSLSHPSIVSRDLASRPGCISRASRPRFYSPERPSKSGKTGTPRVSSMGSVSKNHDKKRDDLIAAMKVQLESL